MIHLYTLNVYSLKYDTTAQRARFPAADTRLFVSTAMMSMLLMMLMMWTMPEQYVATRTRRPDGHACPLTRVIWSVLKLHTINWVGVGTPLGVVDCRCPGAVLKRRAAIGARSLTHSEETTR